MAELGGFKKFESPTAAGGKKQEEGSEHPIEDALANRMYYRTESLSSELISSAKTPRELFTGVRSLEKMLEDGNIPQGLTERYTPPRELSIMYERGDTLSITIDELKTRGLIRNGSYDDATGEGKPKERKYASLALSVEEVPIEITDKEGNTREVGADLRYFFGTPEKRKEMARAYERAVKELEVRDIIGEHIGVRLNIEIRDSLETLTALMHGGRIPKFKGDHLHALFNMPGLEELESNPENRHLGDQVEEAMFLNLVMLNSGNKQRIQDFLERPGAKYLIAKMAKEKEMTYDAWVKENIGDVASWVDDNNRDLQKTWREEALDGRRGTLTKWANVSAWGGNPGEFGDDKEKAFIEETIGGLVGGGAGGIEASWIAATMMRVIGAYASEGYVSLPSGKSLLPLGEGRYISGDDAGKFWAYMFNYKEGTKGRRSGLKDMIGKIPDLAMNLFDWAQVEMADLPKNPDGTYQRRSIWDAWLGTAGGRAKTDLLTGQKSTTELTTEESYHRLGDVNFKSLEREFHGHFTIMQWLMGNAEGPTGILIEALKTDFKFEDFSLHNLKAIWKYIGIVMNPVVLTKGSTQLYTNAFTADKVVQKNYFRNLMMARIQSASFAIGILNEKRKFFNPESGGDAEVPLALLVKAFIEVVLAGNPTDEESLVRHYADKNEVLRKLGKSGIPGAREDVSGVLDARFEPVDPKEKELAKYVGKVTGRKV